MNDTGKLIPGQALIYEKDDHGTVYARYRDPPYNSIPRWEVGTSSGISQPEKRRLSYRDWDKLIRLAEKDETFARQLDKTLLLYYMLKDNYE